MLDFHPFSLFKENFTVYAVQTVSADAGITSDGQGPAVKDTYFGVNIQLSGSWEIPFSLTQPNKGVPRVMQLAHATSSNAAMTQLLVNSDVSGFSGVAFMMAENSLWV